MLDDVYIVTWNDGTVAMMQEGMEKATELMMDVWDR